MDGVRLTLTAKNEVKAASFSNLKKIHVICIFLPTCASDANFKPQKQRQNVKKLGDFSLKNGINCKMWC